MKILQRYIGKTVLVLIIMALLLVLGVDFLFAYVHELGGVGRGDYNATAALLYTALTLPGRLYDLFPMASLIGVLLALGLLSSRSELIVMRGSGVSVLQITAAVAKVGLLMALAVMLLGEYAVPKAEYAAESLKIRAKSAGQAMLTARGTWVREGDNFIHIRTLLPKGVLQGVTVYQFDEKHELQTATYVKQAKYRKSQWQLEDIRQSLVSAEQVTTDTQASAVWPELINPNLLSVLLYEPDDLSLLGLTRYIEYLKSNNLDASHYQLIFWKKVLQPFSVIVMVLLGIPFIFGPLRSASMGLRILAGIVLGFTFYLANEIFGPLSIVYHFPAVFAASVPVILFAGVGFLMMRRVR